MIVNRDVMRDIVEGSHHLTDIHECAPGKFGIAKLIGGNGN
jgi:hypothetical protein